MKKNLEKLKVRKWTEELAREYLTKVKKMTAEAVSSEYGIVESQVKLTASKLRKKYNIDGYKPRAGKLLDAELKLQRRKRQISELRETKVPKLNQKRVRLDFRTEISVDDSIEVTETFLTEKRAKYNIISK